MLKNRRERILAGVLGVVGVGCFAGEALCEALLHPFGDQEKVLASVSRKVGDQSLIFQRVEHAQRRLKHDLRSSLPPDPSVAGTLYQNWLVELTRNHGLTEAVITPSSPHKEKEMGYRLGFTVQTASSPTQIGAFIDSFQQAPLLHRITQLDLSSAATSGPTSATKEAKASSPTSKLTAVISIEALALSAAEPRQQLFPEEKSGADDVEVAATRDIESDGDDAENEDAEADDAAEASDESAPADDDEAIITEVRKRRLAASQSLQARIAAQQDDAAPVKSVLKSARPSSVTTPKPTDTASEKVSARRPSQFVAEGDTEFVSMQRLLASARLFDRYEPAPPRPTVTRSTPQPAPAKPDPLTQLQFVATWANGPVMEAWVFDSNTRQNIILRPGNTVRLLDRQALVASVRGDQVTVVLENRQLDWKIGETLKSLIKLPATSDGRARLK